MRRTDEATRSSIDRFQPTRDEIEREVGEVTSLRLSPDLQSWVDRYSRIGLRNEYLWKWCRRGVEVTTLSCVPAEAFDDLADTKVLGVMLDVLIDDVADERGDDAILEHLLDLPVDAQQSPVEALPPGSIEYVNFAGDVWREINERVGRLPRYEEFASLLKFDYRQLFNAMRYSHLINEDPSLFNMTEHDLYLPHNMHMMVSSTMDLMASPAFDRRELGAVREVVNRAQYMGRIGNLVTTWERELAEKDFTSGVFAAALSQGVLSVDELAAGDVPTIRAAIETGRLEEYFLRRWHLARREVLRMKDRLTSVDVGELAAGLQRLIRLHLGSRGRK